MRWKRIELLAKTVEMVAEKMEEVSVNEELVPGHSHHPLQVEGPLRDAQLGVQKLKVPGG